MKNQHQKLRTIEVNLNANSEVTGNRRVFLEGMGAMGLAAVTGAMKEVSAQSADSRISVPLELSSIAKVEVTREETFDVPGGKESFFEWQVRDDKGVTKKFIVHTARVDGEGNYTIVTDLRINTYRPDMDIHGEPVSTKQQHITAFGIKGETLSSIRNDQVTVTTVHSDGSTSREKATVPVRLDLSEFANQDFATIIANIGNKYLNGKE